MIAARSPLCLDLGILTALSAGLLLMHCDAAKSQQITTYARPDCGDEWIEEERPRPHYRLCDPYAVTNVVIRGQFTSAQREGFAISFAGARGHYTAMTDERGYFEVRIPREDFAGDVCAVPHNFGNHFADDSMKLTYRIDVEH